MEKRDSFNHDDKGMDDLMQPEERKVLKFNFNKIFQTKSHNY